MRHSIGQKINELRKRYQMTQDELAQQMGVSSQAVSKWGNRHKHPRSAHADCTGRLFPHFTG